MTKELILSRGKVALVDDEDYEWLNQWKWSARPDKKRFYAYRVVRKLSGEQVTMLLHRKILDAPIGMQIDHINGDGLDNRRSNLRLATNTENSRNSGLKTNNKSGFKGVFYTKSNRKWRSTISVNRQRVHLGYFDNIEEAALAYDKAALEYHGEFASLNFPKESLDNGG